MTRSDARSNVEDPGEQVGALPVDRGQQAGGARRDVGVGVDLAVRVGERDADRLAPILEREDLLDARKRRQRRGAIGPGLDDGAGTGAGLRAERAGVLGAEAHHLAPADGGAGATESRRVEVVEPARCVGTGGCAAARLGQCRSERGRLVLEDCDVVARRDLGRVASASAGRADRARREAGRPGSAGRRRPIPSRPSARHGASSRCRVGSKSSRASTARSAPRAVPGSS